MPDKHTSNIPLVAADASSMSPATVKIQSAPESNRRPDPATGGVDVRADGGAPAGELDDFEHAAIGETFNRGMDRAAACLSEMTGSEISLSVPDLRILRRRDAAERLKADAEPDITGVKELFCGAFHGSAMLLFPTRASFNLVRLLLKEAVPPIEYLTEMEEEALLETGNIVLNACLGVIAEALRMEILNEVPHAVRGQANQLLIPDDQLQDDRVIQMNMDFGVDGVTVRGCLSMVLDITSLDHFRNRLAKHFGSAA